MSWSIEGAEISAIGADGDELSFSQGEELFADRIGRGVVLSDNDLREALKGGGSSRETQRFGNGLELPREHLGQASRGKATRTPARARGCRQWTCRLKHRALDDVVFVANEAGSQRREHLGSGFRCARRESYLESPQGENVVASSTEALRRLHSALAPEPFSRRHRWAKSLRSA